MGDGAGALRHMPFPKKKKSEFFYLVHCNRVIKVVCIRSEQHLKTQAYIYIADIFISETTRQLSGW